MIVNIYIMYPLQKTPRYSWNIAKFGVKHQSTNHSTIAKVNAYFQNYQSIC